MTGPSLVMLIRHGEKPPPSGEAPLGVTADGTKDKHSLTVRGWTRAGALIGFFATAHDGVEPPTKIYAAMADTGGPHGRRASETVTPLAEAANIPLDLSIAVGNEADLATAILADEGVVLVSWEHHNIPVIVRALGVADFSLTWPDDRFDLVWICRQTPGGWNFSQIGQHLLGSDKEP
jgi:hypothetical protein